MFINKTVTYILLFFLVFIVLELLSRYLLGLGEAALYIESSEFEYIYKPDQDASRFGNSILTNEYSMRSEELNKGENRILVFGDSVLNGGSLTDHSKLATSLFEKKLKESCNENARVLNVSAGSWGPDNAFAYLNKYGSFDANEIILVFSSHDAHDSMTHEAVVGIHPKFPNTQPYSALTDGFFRYFIPKIKGLLSNPKEVVATKINKVDFSEVFNSGWIEFIRYSKNHGVNLFVVLHPTKSEIAVGEYNANGEEIIKLLSAHKIPFYLELNDTSVEYYRDEIHYNEGGQYFLYTELYFLLKQRVCKRQVSEIGSRVY